MLNIANEIPLFFSIIYFVFHFRTRMDIKPHIIVFQIRYKIVGVFEQGIFLFKIYIYIYNQLHDSILFVLYLRAEYVPSDKKSKSGS